MLVLVKLKMLSRYDEKVWNARIKKQTSNKFNGILTAIGHGFGIGIYALFAVIGVGLIIKTNVFIFSSLKFLSIIFLFYLGIQALIKKDQIEYDKIV